MTARERVGKLVISYGEFFVHRPPLLTFFFSPLSILRMYIGEIMTTMTE